MIGPDDDESAESLDVMVVSPMWIAEQARSGPVIGRHTIIMREFRYEELAQLIAAYCGKCVAPTWAEAAMKLDRLGRWEFEDYLEH